MNIYSIYKATCIINNKPYIGFTINLRKRIVSHKHYSKFDDSKFYDAIKKHGFDNFKWEIIYQSKDGEHTLKVMENHFIEQYDSYRNGYNSTLGGDGTLDYKHTEESKKKISESHKGRIFTKEWKEKLSKSGKGRKMSDETKAKMAEVAKNRVFSEETRKKMSESHKRKNSKIKELDNV
jgi:group I intron endonuclease